MSKQTTIFLVESSVIARSEIMKKNTQGMYFSILLVLMLFTALFAAGCGGGGSSGGGGGVAVLPPVQQDTATFTGQTSAAGPLAGVDVSSGGVSVQTDANGFYRLADAPIPSSGRVVLTFKKNGYATYQRNVYAEKDGLYSVSVSLTLYDINELSVDQTQAQSLNADDSNGVTKVILDIPANSIQGAAAGNVKVSVAIGDPSTAAGRAAFPGDYMAAPSADSEPDTPLDSVAFSEISIKDANGDDVTSFDPPAVITMRLPDEFQTGGAKAGTYAAGDTVPWWSYNETNGTWIREDADPTTEEIDDSEIIDINGVLYSRGLVTHLSWWNTDQPIDTQACICVYVMNACDGTGSPVSGIEVKAAGVSYNGETTAMTDENGKACVTVKRSESADNRETVKISARTGNVSFNYDVTDAAEGDVANDYVYTPLEPKSDCQTLANNICAVFDGIVQGTVTYQLSGTPVTGFTLYSDVGSTAETNSAGFYSMRVPKNQQVLVFAPGLVSQAATVTGGPVTVDFVLPNRAPIIDSLTQTPTGPVQAGSQVRFDARAHDPDGDAVTYQWAANSGTLSQTSGTSTTWTAPQGSGTASVTLTVADDKGATAVETRSVVYNSGTPSTSLKVTIKNSKGSDTPVQGVYVILHGTDNKSEQQFIITGADGAADFGDISRERATVTIAYDSSVLADRTAAGDAKNLMTVVGALVGDWVYYLQADAAEACSSPIPINVTVNWPDPAVGTYAFIQPFGYYVVQGVNPTQVNVCPFGVQSDDLISILAYSNNYVQGQDAQIGEYGFLLDQTLTSQGNYTVDMTRIPTTVSWNTVYQNSSTPATINNLNFTGSRKGVPYNINTLIMSTPAAVGTFKYPSDFPLDHVWLTANKQAAEQGDVTLTTLKKYDVVPQSLANLPIPDFALNSLDFDAGTSTYSWSVSGAMATDVFMLNLNDWTSNATWTANVGGDRTSFTLPDLPTEISGWFDINNASESMFSASDWDAVSGFDDMWSMLIGGTSPISQAARLFQASTFVVVGGGGDAQADATDKPELKTEQSLFLGGLEGFLRQ